MKVLKLLTLLTILHSYVVKLPCVEITNVSSRVAKRPFASQWDKILSHVAHSFLKGAFFQKVRFVFQISQSPKKIIPKNYPELEI